MVDFIKQPAFEIGRRVEIRGPGAWFVVLTPTTAKEEEPLPDFVADLSAVLEKVVRTVYAPSSIRNLKLELSQPENDPIVIVGLDKSTPDKWSALDINRSGLVRNGAVVLWLSNVGLTNLCKYAPNLKSLSAAVFFNWPQMRTR